MKGKMWIWVLIVIIVVAGLVYVTMMGNTKNENSMQVEGVKVTVLQEGNGEVAKLGDTVSMNYTGKLTTGTVFDSNVDPKFNHAEPFQFTLGAGQVIRGWDNGIVGMKVGEKRLLEIEPAYAYGDQGIGPIPANSTLVFEVELVSIEPSDSGTGVETEEAN